MALRLHSLRFMKSTPGRFLVRLSAPFVMLAGGTVTISLVGADDPAAAALLTTLFGAGALLSWVASRPGPAATAAPPTDTKASLVDIETGLGNQTQLFDMLGREIARYRRYGRKCSLGVIQSEVVSWRPGQPGELPPSSAKHVAGVICQAVRESDAVVRLDRNRFGILLTECERAGALSLIERVRNALSAAPFARNADGTGVYIRVWGGAVEVSDEQEEAALYLQAAITETDSMRPRREGESLLVNSPALRARANRGSARRPAA